MQQLLLRERCTATAAAPDAQLTAGRLQYTADCCSSLMQLLQYVPQNRCVTCCAAVVYRLKQAGNAPEGTDAGGGRDTSAAQVAVLGSPTVRMQQLEAVLQWLPVVTTHHPPCMTWPGLAVVLCTGTNMLGWVWRCCCCWESSRG